MKTFPAGTRKLASILAGLALFLTIAPVHAQAGEPVQLTPPDTSQFPKISLSLDVRDSSGGFISGLTPADISLTENGEFVPVDELKETQPGLDISVAINASPSMAVRNAEGKARFDLIAQALSDWASQPAGTSPDVYSLFTNGGKPLFRVESAAAWLEALNSYKADFRNSKPSLESLRAALSATSGAVEQPGMRRAILWITSPPEGSLLTSLAELNEPLQKSGARLFIWSVSPAAAFNSVGSNALQQLAEGSGGQFFAFSGSEGFPDLNAYFQPMRGLYQLTYTSAIQQGGDQNLSAQIQRPDGTLASQPVHFQVNLRPPNPMLVSPPTEILRTSPADSLEPLKALSPLSRGIRILVEFPDGHPRPLRAVRLYVDGTLAAQNTKEPFEQFQWDLSGYTQTGSHMLRVEAEDSLGLSKQSLEIPVEVRVVIPPADLKTQALRHRAEVTWAAVLLAGLVLGGIIFWGIRKGLFQRRKKPASNPRDPLTQPVSIRQGTKARGHLVWLDHASWPRIGARMEGAQLVWLGPEGEVLPAAPVKLEGHEVSFGREPAQVTCVLGDASVEGLHARLERDEKGAFLLHDMGSVAGTWVNYAPVTTGGTHLEHGDIIHIGRVAFRFMLLKPGATRTPQIEKTSETS